MLVMIKQGNAGESGSVDTRQFPAGHDLTVTATSGIVEDDVKIETSPSLALDDFTEAGILAAGEVAIKIASKNVSCIRCTIGGNQGQPLTLQVSA